MDNGTGSLSHCDLQTRKTHDMLKPVAPKIDFKTIK